MYIYIYIYIHIYIFVCLFAYIHTHYNFLFASNSCLVISFSCFLKKRVAQQLSLAAKTLKTFYICIHLFVTSTKLLSIRFLCFFCLMKGELYWSTRKSAVTMYAMITYTLLTTSVSLLTFRKYEEFKNGFFFFTDNITQKTNVIKMISCEGFANQHFSVSN